MRQMGVRSWFFLALSFWICPVNAQSYPIQPVKLIVPWPPGGGSPDDFAKFILSEIGRYADIVKASGAKVE